MTNGREQDATCSGAELEGRGEMATRRLIVCPRSVRDKPHQRGIMSCDQTKFTVLNATLQCNDQLNMSFISFATVSNDVFLVLSKEVQTFSTDGA